ncbi:protein FAM184A isoform X9 [Rattus norvegicus]|uniref:protein FAM184A isoform X9 n=1 Tax=Rattus norvegicus TaxID=10116 RepID=UPI000810290B|nr:protein FAM184A isoform X9 [Rattus norvegicus]
MATPGMSWQHHYYGGSSSGPAKFTTSPAAAQLAGHNMDYSQDMHLKMSKKIAQLTKVIYALNTKNDEHDSAIQALKDAHEEEIQQILAETREKILLYKSRVTEELDLKRKIQVLEASLEDHVKMKQEALKEFEAYKRRVEDMQLCAEAQHVQRIVTMSREVEEIRKKFEERLRSFGQLQVQFENDKQSALEELRTTHRLEVQELLRSQEDHSASMNLGQEKAEELHRREVEALNNTLEELRLEKKELIEEYEGKLSKAQLFYERELDNLKRSQLFTAESLQASRDKEADLRKEFQGQEAILRKTIGKLKTELQMVQDEASSLLDKCQKLQMALATAENNVQKVNEVKRTQQEYYEMELKNLQTRLEGEVAQLNETHGKTLEELAWKHHMAIEAVHSNASRDKIKLQTELEEQHKKEKLSLEEDKNQLQLELENLKQALGDKLTSANQEIDRLQDLVRKSEQGLGSAEGLIASLQDSQERLQSELDLTKGRLKETKDALLNVEAELQQERHEHEQTLATMKEEEKLRVDRMAHDLEIKWTENLRQECSKLRQELKLQHEEDKKCAMSQLLQLKEREKTAARDSWQKKVEDLLNQRHSLGEALHKSINNISLLKQNLELQLCQSQTSLQQLQAQFTQERQRLTQELEELEEQHQQRHKSLKEAHVLAFQTMEEEKEKEQRALETHLQQKHSAELQSLKDAHRESMEGFRVEMEQELQTLRFELEDEGKAMLASLRSELNHQHATSIDLLRHSHHQELAAAKMELERSIDISRRQSKEHMCRISDLQDELRHREHHITDLDKEVQHLHESISTLTKELELKGKEILRIRSESNQQMRLHEQDLNKRLEKELDVMTADHLREKNIMRADFNKTNELLKEINAALQVSLEDMEEKYLMRESRPEDLQMIAELKSLLTERDQVIKKLIEDNKFYQLELVNRETNFNKIFNTSPTVGVINPLAKQKKKNDKSPANRFVSVPNLSALESGGMGNGHPTRLEPIPNSPAHDVEFNSNKPLPQPLPPKEPKTFLSPPQSEASPVASPDPQRQEWFARYFTF